MAEGEPTLVDTNVILDITKADPVWAVWSMDALSRQTRPVVNPIIFTELCYTANSAEEVEEILTELNLEYRELPKDALYLAAQAYKQYRKRGGTRTAPLADFFIGAHASADGLPLLTRDAVRYRTSFPGLKLITPDLP